VARFSRGAVLPMCLILLCAAGSSARAADSSAALQVQRAYDQARAVPDDAEPKASPEPDKGRSAYELDQAIPPDKPAPVYAELATMRRHITDYFAANALVVDRRRFEALAQSFSGVQTLREKQFFRYVCDSYGIDPC
jgi:hypothetical protein